ncbi:hypothetical protein [uncultured Arcticibacterium sp.]|uniref:hypothetical protein n=1 Tax=uncultured Arcticibacterium sp. TaxID=2173042 RepID=UPI0030F7C9D3
MKKEFVKIVILLLLIPLVFSCKKKNKGDVDPFSGDNDVCPLLSMVNGEGKTIRDFEYVQDDLIRIYTLEENETIMSFKYNEKGLIKTMEVETENNSETLKVAYTYDEKDRVSNTSTSVGGLPFMENSFVLNDGKISAVVTTVKLFGKKISGNTRIVYQGNNVSQVLTSIDGEPEKLAFVGDEYDNKPQFHPKAYKIAALGFVGIANNFFSFFGENNLISGRIYDEDGKVDQTTGIAYTYNNEGLPMASETTTDKAGEQTRQSVSYQFQCN